MQPKGFTPGKPAVELICAAGPVGRRLLEEIAHPALNPTNRREFGRWIGDECGGVVFAGGEAIPLLLQVGDAPRNGKRALFIEEVSVGRLSLKPATNGNGTLVLRVNRELCARRLRSFASQVVATFVLHGFGWKDRDGREYSEPYGKTPSRVPRKRKRHRGGRRERLARHHYF